MPPKKLFISYRSSDAAKVDKIARDLGLLKYDDGTPRYSTWQDKLNLPPASPSWWDAIVDAVIDCEMFVFNLSLASLQSEVCRAELEYAHKRHRPIIAVVLDGEFFLDPQSGKYDLPPETWTLVPDWLRQGQFLFYISTDFYNKFQEAVAGFERKWPRDIPAPRPLNPDSRSVHGSNHALYSAACDYAERLAFTDAEKHFDVLVRRDDSDYADVAAQWLELIRLYAELIEIDETRNARFIFNTRWANYQALFPKIFLDDIFDPQGFATRGNKVRPSVSRLETPTPKPAIASPPKPRSKVLDLLPAPFEWIDIPAGKVTLINDDDDDDDYIKRDKPQTFDVSAFAIARYPITNAQYAKFIEADGYTQERWWTDAGWDAKAKGMAFNGKQWVETGKAWTQPRYWTDVNWNGAQHPVVGVSWYEAVAFCNWLSEASGDLILLSTEQQWQRAAQGDQGWAYPWGNNFDAARCNTIESKFGKTTPVTQYSGKGDSPFGVTDLAGNVCEWCVTDYHLGYTELEGIEGRVLRGGSWYDYPNDARAAFRLGNNPSSWFLNYGFRVVCGRIPV